MALESSSSHVHLKYHKESSRNASHTKEKGQQSGLIFIIFIFMSSAYRERLFIIKASLSLAEIFKMTG